MTLCRVALLLAAILAPGAHAEAEGVPTGLSLELHRIRQPRVHTESYQSRRLQGIVKKDGSLEVVPLNPGLGTHYAWVYVGTPPQRASVIADTGSSILAFPCSGCQGCGKHTDQPFVAANSSTLTHVTCENRGSFVCRDCIGSGSEGAVCRISQSYLEGSSWEATVVDDIVYLGDEASQTDKVMQNAYGTRYSFGCQTSETGLFITQVADGIMGLANNDRHLVAKLYNEKKIPHKLFTLCFDANGGSMAIGSPDVSRHRGKIQYAKLDDPRAHDFYGVRVTDIRVGGESLGAAYSSSLNGRFIVDSGTTDSYFPNSLKLPFQELFKKHTGLEYVTTPTSAGGPCNGYTHDDLANLPNIEVTLADEQGKDMVLIITPSQYLEKEDNGKYCSGVFFSEPGGGVIGANMMRDRDVIFDQENGRVGFVDAECTYQRSDPANADGNRPPSDDLFLSPNAIGGSGSSGTNASTIASNVSSSTPPSSSGSKSSVGNEPQFNTTQPSEEPATTAVPKTTPTPKPIQTEAPTSAPKATETPAPTPTNATEAPTTPIATIKANEKAKNTRGSGGSEERPMVLSIVGTFLAVAFVLIVVISLRRQKSKKSGHAWRRVNERDEDDDDDNDDEAGLMEKGKRSRRSDQHLQEEDSDEEEEEEPARPARSGGLLRGHGRSDAQQQDEDDEDDEEIFARRHA